MIRDNRKEERKIIRLVEPRGKHGDKVYCVLKPCAYPDYPGHGDWEANGRDYSAHSLRSFLVGESSKYHFVIGSLAKNSMRDQGLLDLIDD